jgi:hypothetical protein
VGGDQQAGDDQAGDDPPPLLELKRQQVKADSDSDQQLET